MENIERIKSWLGSGSINIFGMPFSGKDTVGTRLADVLGGKFLSSGAILREAQERDAELKAEMNSGALANTDKFRSIVLPYFGSEHLNGQALILSSVGRWEGEEHDVIKAASDGSHPIKAAIFLSISAEEAERRRQIALESNDRGTRGDDENEEALRLRIAEFNEKTLPVLKTYEDLGLLIKIESDDSKDVVFERVINALIERTE